MISHILHMWHNTIYLPSSVFCLWLIWEATWKRFYCVLLSLPPQISWLSLWQIGKFAYLQSWWPDEVRCGAAWSSHRWCLVPGRVQSLQIVRGSLHGQLQKEREREGGMRSVRRKINIKSATRQRRSLTVCHLPAQNFANSCQRKERTNRQQTVPAVPQPLP